GEAVPVAGDGFHNRRRPIIAADGKRLHGADLSLRALRAFTIALVNHKDVSDLHNSRFDRLNIVSHPGNKNDHGDIGQLHDINFVLAYADSLDKDDLFPGRVEQSCDIRSRRSKPAEKSAGGHAADVDTVVGMMRLHANAVAENGSPGVRARWIDSNNADSFFLLSVLASKLIDQRALARTRRSGQPDYGGISAVLKQRLHQLRSLCRIVFNRGDRSRERANVPGTNAADEGR